MNNSKAKAVAFIGVMTALEFIVMFLETYVFTILIPVAPPCILSISVAITISVYGDWENMFIGGTIMGICSFFIALIIGNAVFMLPWISIVPRIFIGIVAFGVAVLVKKLVKNKQNKFCKNYLPYGIGAIFGTLTNTVLVLAIMYFGRFIGIEVIVGTFVAINFPLEIVGSAILTPVLVNAVQRFLRRKG